MKTSERTFGFDPKFGFAPTLAGTKAAKWIGPDEAWYSSNTPLGPSTVHLQLRGLEVKAEAWGSGQDWLLGQAPKLLGSQDNLDGFNPTEAVSHLWRQSPFLMSRTDQLWDALVVAILGQKIQTSRAKKSRLELARCFGEPAPGPTPHPTWVLPTARTVASMGYADFHPLNVERRRADTLIRTAREMGRLDGLSDLAPSKARARLERIPGIGPWTSAMATSIAFGDADAIPLGDYHIANTIGWLMTSQPRSTDEEMLELLKPYSGHRWRVIRLAKGSTRAPRYGPRLSVENISRH